MSFDRALFEPYFEKIFEFAAARKLTIGGKFGLSCLYPTLNTAPNEWAPIDLYCDNLAKNMRDLTDALFANVNEKLLDKDSIILTSFIRDREYTISIEERAIAFGHVLGKYRGMDLAKIMTPVKTGKYLVLSGELQGIRIAQMLYNPAQIGKFLDNLEIFTKIADALIAKHPSPKWITAGHSLCKKVFDAIPAAFGNSAVIVGDYAWRFLFEKQSAEKSPILQHNRLQFLAGEISDESLTDFAKKTLGAAARVIPFFANLPSDFRFKKWTIYAADEPVCDVFNSLAYEAIPAIPITFESRKYFFANYMTAIRIILIDSHMMSCVAALTGATKSTIFEQKAAILSRQFLSNFREQHCDWIFPKEYIGMIIPEAVAKKQIAHSTEPPYCPTAHRD
ncbi:MAG: hypothetical protein M0R33_17105 [Methylomonas sp.]|uniref:hypothetical protein n=1 Tax=Methylomonas sp. TaxID=418 RepID=UPI0025CDE54B|nr:hypothetical protein [Methylomonas sp.]MCK9608165.1 hypothetical protein [Methylomonas sp.]